MDRSVRAAVSEKRDCSVLKDSNREQREKTTLQSQLQFGSSFSSPPFSAFPDRCKRMLAPPVLFVFWPLCTAAADDDDDDDDYDYIHTHISPLHLSVRVLQSGA